MDIGEELVRIFDLGQEAQIQQDKEMFGEGGFLSFRRAAAIRKYANSDPIHVFVKSSDPTRSDLNHTQAISNHFCRTECMFYGVMAPILDRVMQRCQLQPVYPLAYENKISSKGSILVMEDLTKQGFALVDRKFLTLAEAECVVKTMARLQAAFWIARTNFDYAMDSAMFGADSPFVNPLGKSQDKGGFDMQSQLHEGVEYFKESLPKHCASEADQKLILHGAQKVLEIMGKKIAGKSEELMKMPIGFVQGDLWFSNFMFKGSGDSLSCRIVDWQFWNVGLFGFDLGILFLSSLSNEMMISEMDNLWATFYNTFKEIFEAKTGQPVPFSAEQAKLNMAPALCMGIFWVLVTAITLWSHEAVDTSNIMKNAAYVMRHKIAELLQQ